MSVLKRFLSNEASGGIMIIVATALALICQNTILTNFYNEFLRMDAGFILGRFQIIKPVILWVNDGLMALFFFYIGLEVKREIMIGELSSPSKVALPVIGGLGGVIVPAAVFYIINIGDSFALRGWAIPIVSDTAFAVGILLLLKSRIPPTLKIFLLLLAIIDDICAVVIIAIFYTSELSGTAIAMGSAFIALLAYLNFKKTNSSTIYTVVGLLLWLSFVESGVHSTLSGIITAFFIPLQTKNGNSLLTEIEHSLHGFITFFVMPVFAFVNAGISLNKEAFMALLQPVPIGIMAGLLLGKPFGVYLFSFIAFKLKLTKLPAGANKGQFLGLSFLTGIGASMSLFITSIAYEDSDIFVYADKLAILIASFVAAVVGYMVIKYSSKSPVQTT